MIFRLDCLRPAGLDNLFAAGRCLSATTGAMTSARVIGTALATGWAAGTAAAFQALDRPLDQAVEAIRRQMNRMNVFDTLSQAARQWPDRPAIIDAAGSLDYQSLWREIEALRAQLRPVGGARTARVWACGPATDAPSSSARWRRWAAAPW